MDEKIVPEKSKLEEKLRDYYMYFIENDDIIPISVVDGFIKDVQIAESLKLDKKSENGKH